MNKENQIQKTEEEEIISCKPFISEILVKKVGLKNNRIIFYFKKTYELK